MYINNIVIFHLQRTPGKESPSPDKTGSPIHKPDESKSIKFAEGVAGEEKIEIVAEKVEIVAEKVADEGPKVEEDKAEMANGETKITQDETAPEKTNGTEEMEVTETQEVEEVKSEPTKEGNVAGTFTSYPDLFPILTA